jgi:hypothetical protein
MLPNQLTRACTTSNKMRTVGMFLLVSAAIASGHLQPALAGPVEASHGAYKVLSPIQSGNLMLFPVVKTSGRAAPSDQFLTLDEGLKSGEVEVTEAGKARGLVRSRGGVPVPSTSHQGDQVNTLVLINHSHRPLLMLAGEIVTGGKQDRVIAKDRIVPPGGDPVDLSVFCIEPGRWTESSANFGATAKEPSGSFMVQPPVRQQAMVAKDQQQVWSAVGGAISEMAAVAAPARNEGASQGMGGGVGAGLGTTSYAKAMQARVVSSKVDEAEAPLMKSREQILAALIQEHAVGVVVAVRGEIIWADIFAGTDLLTRYWPKLVRSYAAEGLSGSAHSASASLADAQQFLDAPAEGTAETSEGEVGIYRYREIKHNETDTFVLEALLPGTGYDVHLSKLKLKGNYSIHHSPYVTR